MIRKKEIKDLTSQIKQMNETGQGEYIYSQSASAELRALCEQLNIYIDAQEKIKKDSQKTKESSRQMLSNISHDLKTPLTVIRGMAELIDLEQKTISENQAMLLKINEKVIEVQQMMQTFFDLNKIEAEDYNLNFEKIELVAVVKRVMLDYFDILETEQIELFFELPEEQIYIHADTLAMERILHNLFSNAIKYGSEGKIIGCKVISQNSKVEIIVWDRGKGIAEQYQHQIFERLFTLEDSRNKNYSGSGIGLTITKRLVEKHQGTISVSSIPHKYTEFKIILPLI